MTAEHAITDDGAYALVRSGVVALTLADWIRQPLETQNALVVAARQVAAEDALMVARAASGPEGWAGVYSEIDGGALHTRLLMEEAVGEAVEADKREGIR